MMDWSICNTLALGIIAGYRGSESEKESKEQGFKNI